MFEDQAFQHGLRGGAFVVIELLQGLELQEQAVIWAAFVVVEQELMTTLSKRRCCVYCPR